MNVAIYARCSTTPDKQEILNQLEPLRKFASAKGYEVVAEFGDYISGGDSNRPGFREMLTHAQKGKFQAILIWSLDRFSREGIHNTLGYIRQLQRLNVALISLQESWLDTTDRGLGELLISIFSWVAAQEKERIRERIQAGLRNAKRNGRVLGRPPGSKDKGRRRRSGYNLRWQKNI